MAVFAAVISYIFQMTSFVVLRRKLPNIERPYRSRSGIPGAVIAGAFAATALVTIFLNDAYRPGVYGVAIYYVLGVLYFAIAGRNRLVLSPEEEFALTQGSRGIPGQEGYVTTAAEQEAILGVVRRAHPRPRHLHRCHRRPSNPDPSRGGGRSARRPATVTARRRDAAAGDAHHRGAPGALPEQPDRHRPLHVHRPPGPLHGQARPPGLLHRGVPGRGRPARLSVPAGDRHGDGAAPRLPVRQLGDRLRRLPDDPGPQDLRWCPWIDRTAIVLCDITDEDTTSRSRSLPGRSSRTRSRRPLPRDFR